MANQSNYEQNAGIASWYIQFFLELVLLRRNTPELLDGVVCSRDDLERLIKVMCTLLIRLFIYLFFRD